MIETKFWIQGEKTLLHRGLDFAVIISFGIGAVCLAVPQWRFVLPLPAILLSGTLIYYIAATASGVTLYHTQGQLEISEQGIKVNGVEEHEFQSLELRRVEVKFSSYRGQSSGKNVKDGSNNIIRFYSVIGEHPIAVTFLADSYAQSQLLVKILKSWRTIGIKIVADGIDLV